ncbi:hypothetical protein IFM58399_06941 [Aspergillus lentulus]|uniref:GATA-type domain-containing protein n=1 Tax=Aspergillus lentulus TaxID=293939 RepID=A0ABQ1A2J5_ASPLE|nr:uncharacterized protein IFM58399_06941 [Aspergillus lentulus]GFF43409.1 hypothetical protein IFM58399_06941 [Aspergillus lentulus]GFF72037.1 hypothetical protein IFM60648_03582 [Aspergillus lentulus]
MTTQPIEKNTQRIPDTQPVSNVLRPKPEGEMTESVLHWLPQKGAGPTLVPQDNGTYMCNTCDSWAKNHKGERHWNSDGSESKDRVCQCPGCPKKGAGVSWAKWPDGNHACRTCWEYRGKNPDDWQNHDHSLFRKRCRK